jgi:hypothetical protein
MFDEEPDADVHGECAAEIAHLKKQNEILRADYIRIADAVCRQSSGPEEVETIARKLRSDLDAAIASNVRLRDALDDAEEVIEFAVVNANDRVLRLRFAAVAVKVDEVSK